MSDNVQTAPIIPAGTQPTVFNTKSFNPLQTPQVFQQNDGQAANTPVTGQAVAQQPQPESAFAELAAKKGFKSPDDLAKAYMESEAQKTRVEMSFSELVKLREDAFKPQEVAPVQQNAVQTPDEAIKIVQSMIDARIRPLQNENELNRLFSANTDAKEFVPQMAEVVKANPSISWTDAYKLAKFDALENKAREEGRQDALKTAQLKQAATVGSPALRSEPQTDLMNIISDRSVPFSEVSKILRERLGAR